MNNETIPSLLLADSYKISHAGFTPPGVTEIYSNMTPRFAKYFKDKYPDFDGKYVVFGTQYAIKMIDGFYSSFFEGDKETEINKLIHALTPYIGMTDYSRFESLHDLGYLPIEVKGIDEGSIVSMGVPFVTVRNTHPDYDWLTNYLESLLSQLLWKPLTVATVSREFHKLSMKFAEATSEDSGFVKFQNHDFSMRGQGGVDAGAATGMAWLTHSIGSDNVPGAYFADAYYKSSKDHTIALSIPASEHSVCTINILSEDSVDLKNGETQFLKKVITEYYPSGLVASVFDTYDYWRAISEILLDLKDVIMSRDGKLVVRPDSGDPVDVICGTISAITYDTLEDAIDDQREEASDYLHLHCEPDSYIESYDMVIYAKNTGLYHRLEFLAEIGRERGGFSDRSYYVVESVKLKSKEVIVLTPEQKGSFEVLWEIFGGKINEKGFKELDPHIGLIYGDGITFKRAASIFSRLAEKGFSSSNVVFGIGSYTLNMMSRDDLGIAIKATHAVMDGKNIPLFKDPKTDISKKSAKGYLFVEKHEDGTFKLIDNVSFDEEQSDSNELKVIYRDGVFHKETSLQEVRSRLGIDTSM